MTGFFKVIRHSNRSKARIGEIRTVHGVIKTPAFVPVATKGTLKALLPSLVKDIGIQAAFVNTYHLVTHPGAEIIDKAGGIHKFSRLNIPLMSDSGGFQIFSLARDEKARHNVFSSTSPPKGGSPKSLTQKHMSSLSRRADIRGEEEPLLVKISDEGVKFRSTVDGKLIEFTPEKSIKYQQQIGADMMMAFDECIPYGSSYEYSRKATERTHQWLKRCVKYLKSQISNRKPTSQISKLTDNSKNFSQKFNNRAIEQLRNRQYLYGVIQGGVFEELRKESAEFVVSQPVDGIAIGGVSVGETKKEMREQVGWVADYLPADRPVHLLGVGQFDDIIDLVEYGIDTFDCVEPTRLARMGTLYKNFQFSISNFQSISNFKFKILNSERDILKAKYKQDLSPVDEGCSCYVCANFTKAYLHHLFKQREILGYTLATYHNLWVMEKYFHTLRDLISRDLI